MDDAVKRLFDALRAPAPTAGADRGAQLMDSFFANIEHWKARACDDPPATERPSDVYPIPPPAPPPAPPFVEFVRTLSFEAWAAQSCRLLGANAVQKVVDVAALGFTLEKWRRLDDTYLRMLSDDLRAGRTERPSIYQACYHAELARRQGADAGARGEPPVPAPAPPPAEASAPTAEATSVRAPPPMKGTGEAFDLPPDLREALALLNFRPAPAPVAPSAKPASKTLTAERAPNVGGTLPLGDDNIPKAIASLPFQGAGARGVVNLPNLNVKEYISLRAALVALPDMADQVLRCFGVANEAVRRALDDHWRAQFAARPDLRAERDAAVAEYARWLRGER